MIYSFIYCITRPYARACMHSGEQHQFGPCLLEIPILVAKETLDNNHTKSCLLITTICALKERGKVL